MKKRIVFALAASIAACSSSRDAAADGEVAQSPTTAGTPTDLARAIAQDNEVAAAQKAIDDGHPWRGPQAFALVLKPPASRPPAALIVAARAAAGWDGWTEV